MAHLTEAELKLNNFLSGKAGSTYKSSQASGALSLIKLNYQIHTASLFQFKLLNSWDYVRPLLKRRVHLCPNQPQQTKQTYSIAITDGDSASVSRAVERQRQTDRRTERKRENGCQLDTNSRAISYSQKEECDSFLYYILMIIKADGSNFRNICLPVMGKLFLSLAIQIKYVLSFPSFYRAKCYKMH